jgi:hypothetical protein
MIFNLKDLDIVSSFSDGKIDLFKIFIRVHELIRIVTSLGLDFKCVDLFAFGEFVLHV